MNRRTISFNMSKRGLPVITECGGASTSEGWARGICDYRGEEKTPIYIPRGGHLSNGTHAYFIAQINDYVISVKQQRDIVVEIEVEKITSIYEDPSSFEKGWKGELTRVFHFSEGEWDTEPNAFLKWCIDAMIRKSKAYHCRHPYFCKEIKEVKI